MSGKSWWKLERSVATWQLPRPLGDHERSCFCLTGSQVCKPAKTQLAYVQGYLGTARGLDTRHRVSVRQEINLAWAELTYALVDVLK